MDSSGTDQQLSRHEQTRQVSFTRNTTSSRQGCAQQELIWDLALVCKFYVHLYPRCHETETNQANTFNKHQMELLSKPQNLNF